MRLMESVPSWDDGLAELVLPYELVRTADDTDARLEFI